MSILKDEFGKFKKANAWKVLLDFLDVNENNVVYFLKKIEEVEGISNN